MSRSTQGYTPTEPESIATDYRQTCHALALECSDPPLCEFGVWSSVVDLAADATEHAVMETN